MRRFFLFVLVVFFIFSLLNKKSENEEIRVRVIPNSNEKSDLIIKKEVVQYVVFYLKNAYDEEYKIYEENINATKKQFEYFLEEVINIDCTITFDKHTLYNKTYNNSAVKNEETMTLLVVIGEGAGDNWWGTVYPEFLDISSDEEIKYESLIIRMFEKIKGE